MANKSYFKFYDKNMTYKILTTTQWEISKMITRNAIYCTGCIDDNALTVRIILDKIYSHIFMFNIKNLQQYMVWENISLKSLSYGISTSTKTILFWSWSVLAVEVFLFQYISNYLYIVK